jgi:hypothetical protein
MARDDDFDDRPRRRRDDYDDPGYSSAAPRRASKGVSVVGIVSLVFGLMGLVMSVIPCIGIVGIPVAAVGLLLGIIGLFTSGHTTGRGMPIAGTCVSLAGVLIGSLWIALFAVSVKKGQEGLAEMRVEMEKQAQIAEERRKKEEQELREGKATTVTAARLAMDYEDNVLSADSKYKSKVLEVSGTVKRVGRDQFGKPWIEFETGHDAIVKCEFPREAQGDLEKVEANKTATIRGRCKGVNKRPKSDEIVVENCVLMVRK